MLAAECDFEGGRIVAASVARLAMDPGGRQEIHFQFHAAIAFAGFAASAFGVEGKARGIEAADAGLGQLCKQRADVIEDLHIGRRARTRGFADRRLIDLVAGFDRFFAADFGEIFVLRRAFENRRDALVHERRLARSRNAGEHGEAANGDGGRDVFEVVGAAAVEREKCVILFHRPSLAAQGVGQWMG